jgi:Na+-transporting methylmalonyl-CoA/oxaloacetate decarboxylase gamma subunit
MLSGLLLMALGVWGALIPFIGPYFSYAYTPDTAWTWTSGRLWLEVLPGIAAFVAGFLLLTTAHRAVGVFAGWLGSAAGAWFVLGPIFGRLWNGAQGAAGSPIGGTAHQVWEQIGFFTGLGVVILFLAAQALGRFTVRSVRDVVAAETVRRTTVTEPAATRPVAAPATTAAVERERTAEFEGNRVATPPAETVEAAPASGEGATRVGRRTP